MMTSQNPSQVIRQRIQAAHLHEENTHEFRDFLKLMAPRLHKAVQLPEADPQAALLGFVRRYLENVPNFLEALTHCMQASGIYGEGKIFLQIAEEFFAQPTEVADTAPSLQDLLNKAYLAHRLMEEINDRLIMLCGVPLAPMDMTMSNIVVHELLGESFANDLDMAVHYAVESLFNPEDLANRQSIAEFVSRQEASSWRQRLAEWPCFAEDCSISILLDEDQPSTAVH